MGVLTFLFITGAIVVSVVVGGMVIAALPYLGTRNRSELRAARCQVQSARKALRSIANGDTGNPVLEAQLALEDIDRKELE